MGCEPKWLQKPYVPVSKMLTQTARPPLAVPGAPGGVPRQLLGVSGVLLGVSGERPGVSGELPGVSGELRGVPPWPLRRVACIPRGSQGWVLEGFRYPRGSFWRVF